MRPRDSVPNAAFSKPRRVNCIPFKGDRFDSHPLPIVLPPQPRIFSPVGARTGEISVTLSVTKDNSVTTLFSILGVPFPFVPVTFPSNPGLRPRNFLETLPLASQRTGQ